MNVTYKTLCAEEDNANVPIYGAKQFEIIATHPLYSFVTDYTKPDFTNCGPTP